MELALTVHDVSYEQVAKTIDHSLLRPELTLSAVREGCELAAKYGSRDPRPPRLP